MPTYMQTVECGVLEGGGGGCAEMGQCLVCGTGGGKGHLSMVPNVILEEMQCMFVTIFAKDTHAAALIFLVYDEVRSNL